MCLRFTQVYIYLGTCYETKLCATKDDAIINNELAKFTRSSSYAFQERRASDATIIL